VTGLRGLFLSDFFIIGGQFDWRLTDDDALSENHIRLGDAGDGPTGYLWFEVQDRPETPLTLARKRFYIHHLSVQAGARRHGIASALLRHVEAEALSGGITNIALDTWAANESARGFTPFNLSLSKRLIRLWVKMRRPGAGSRPLRVRHTEHALRLSHCASDVGFRLR